MLWFGTDRTLHVVSEKIYEVKATLPNGNDRTLEIWPGSSMLAYAMHRPGDDVICLVKLLEDGELERYLVPIDRVRLYFRDDERDDERIMFVDTGLDDDESARLIILDDKEQAVLFHVMLDTMQICASDDRMVI